jgi:hypothetical protein
MVELLRIRWGAPSKRAPAAGLHPPEHQLGQAPGELQGDGDGENGGDQFHGTSFHGSQ